MLIALRGNYKRVNRTLLLKSFELVPSLILDCGNAADVHSLFPIISEEQLHSVYVVNLEAIYRFRRGLEEAPYWIQRLGINQMIVTTIAALFSYDDEAENHDVLEHCWELMKKISGKTPVTVGVGEDEKHLKFAGRFADRIDAIEDGEDERLKYGAGYYHAPRYMGG